MVSLPRQGPSAATATAMVLHPEPIRALPPQLPPQPVVTSPLSVRIRPAVLGPPPRTTTHRRFPNSFSSSRSAQPPPSSSSSPASLSPPPSNQHRDTKTPPPPALITLCLVDTKAPVASVETSEAAGSAPVLNCKKNNKNKINSLSRLASNLI